jgi:hypothetical protein
MQRKFTASLLKDKGRLQSAKCASTESGGLQNPGQPERSREIAVTLKLCRDGIGGLALG